MTTVEANGVTLGVEHFGEAAAPLILLAGGTTMFSWPDVLCEALAHGGRHVVRYDLRDSGAPGPSERRGPCVTLNALDPIQARACPGIPPARGSDELGIRASRAAGRGARQKTPPPAPMSWPVTHRASGPARKAKTSPTSLG